MSEFDDYYNELNLSELSQQEVAELCFEAGAQSRQAEIDELKGRIDKAVEILGYDAIGFTGLIQNYDKAKSILKGKEND